jgi:hypothetical protein
VGALRRRDARAVEQPLRAHLFRSCNDIAPLLPVQSGSPPSMALETEDRDGKGGWKR